MRFTVVLTGRLTLAAPPMQSSDAYEPGICGWGIKVPEEMMKDGKVDLGSADLVAMVDALAKEHAAKMQVVHHHVQRQVTICRV